MLKILLTLLGFAAVSSAARAETYFEPVAAFAMVNRGDAVLVDVREADEIVSGMAEAALWLATSTIKEGGPEVQEFLESLDPKQTVIVYCGSGKRASYFVEVLREAGFMVENMGGFSAWVEAGLPVVIPPKF